MFVDLRTVNLGQEKLVFLISSNYTSWILPFRCYGPIRDELFCRHVLYLFHCLVCLQC